MIKIIKYSVVIELLSKVNRLVVLINPTEI
jgi:hypothetical protein